MNSKRKTILERIKHLEDAIAKGREFLESGKHADWHGFHPLFVDKARDGKLLATHNDWIKNVFLLRHERSLTKAHKLLERVSSVGDRPANESSQPSRTFHLRGHRSA